MRTVFVITLVVASSAVFAGPGKDANIVGHWNVVLTNGLPAQATFRSDGTMEFDADNPEAKTMKIIMKAKYHVKGSSLFMTFTGVDFKNTPAAAKSQESAMKESLKKQIQVGTEKKAEIKWSGADAFVTTSGEGKRTTFKRIRK